MGVSLTGNHRRKRIMTTGKHEILPRLFLFGSIFLCLAISTEQSSAQTFDFDEGIGVLTQGLLSVKKQRLQDRKIAVFGIVESKSNNRWEVSSHIEDGIVDELVNEGYTVIERRRINDIIKKEQKKAADFWFDEAQVTQAGKLVGADVVITGRYVRWGGATLRISIRAVSVSDGKVMAANKVKIHTDRISELLKPVAEKEDEKTAEPEQQQSGHPAVNQPTSLPVPSTSRMGSFCCDQFGNKRCTLVQPVPLGSPCFCPGQGYGYTCR